MITPVNVAAIAAPVALTVLFLWMCISRITSSLHWSAWSLIALTTAIAIAAVFAGLIVARVRSGRGKPAHQQSPCP